MGIGAAGVFTNAYGGIPGYLAFKFSVNTGYDYDTKFWSSRDGLEALRQDIHSKFGWVTKLQSPDAIAAIQASLLDASNKRAHSINPLDRQASRLLAQAAVYVGVLASYGDFMGYADHAIDQEEWVLGF